jgi:hypothetical protein
MPVKIFRRQFRKVNTPLEMFFELALDTGITPTNLFEPIGQIPPLS